jgi:hypothetical protein
MIPAAYLGVIEMGFTFAVVAGFVVQQLWSLRDTGSKPPEAPADAPENRDPPDPPAAA